MSGITPAGLNLIKSFEGFSPVPYICPGGWVTIGYGHVIGDDEKLECVSPEEAEALLLRDVAWAEQAVGRLVHVPLTAGQFDALVSFTFNLGGGALQRSTLRRKVNRRAHHEVPGEFMRWVHSGGRRLPGLVRRRAAESRLYRT